MLLTWIAMAASVCMALGAVLLFLHAVKKDWFRDMEDAKYQVFWSDLEKLVNQKIVKKQEKADGIEPEKD